MLYLQNITGPQTVYVPNNGTSAEDMTLKVKSTVDLAETAIRVSDTGSSDRFFTVSVTLPSGLPDGEYEYALESGESVLSTGLLIIGQYTSPNQYNKEIQYEQYSAE